MKKNFVADLIPMAVAVVGVVSLMYLWLSADAAVGLQERLPGADGKPANAGGRDDVVKIAGTLTQGDGAPSELPGAWPRFRGANYDAISTETVSLSRTWLED